MKVLIVEDEPLAAKRLESLVQEVEPEAEVMDRLESVRALVRWWQTNQDTGRSAPDLLLMDIQLADGLSFEAFQQVNITTPVIFTTAYDEYALKAFKVNSVDYLLKPIEKDELELAIGKFKRNQQTSTPENLTKVLEAYGVKPVAYKSRFLLKQGGRFEVVDTRDIQYIYADEKVVFLVTSENRKFIVDETLDELEGKLDPKLFHRINRKYISQLGAIERIEPHFNGRLRLWLHNRPTDEEIFVSREKAEAFKSWLDS
ncbi:LytTR family DNA-binding domain-containing protein [Nibrella saemangeumensis]|uniref:LytTR family DNA-binding domain-containing protein n=1 Tax=Nibrella saemangeumensis TaxID=1084526 RepID=A0ABP8NRI6_9BACT